MLDFKKWNNIIAYNRKNKNKTQNTCLPSILYLVNISFPREKFHWFQFYYFSTLDILWTSSYDKWGFNLHHLFSGGRKREWGNREKEERRGNINVG